MRSGQLVSGSTIVAGLRSASSRLPDSLRHALNRSGLPYVLSFLLKYRQTHAIANFAGNLDQLKAAYRATEAGAGAAEGRFERIVDALVMPNGVRKTTYEKRLTASVAAVLASLPLPRRDIRVLDLPSSAGIASLHNLELIQRQYNVISYVLGDLYHVVLHDRRRRCIFDQQGNLLQVGFKRYFFNVHHGQKLGSHYTMLSACLLLPHSVFAWYLKKRYRFSAAGSCQAISVVHPEVELRLQRGVYAVREMNVFEPIPGRYDLILSFNLLQRNYFPSHAVELGVSHLSAALNESGLLVLGDTESYLVLQKRDGSLIRRLQRGEF